MRFAPPNPLRIADRASGLNAPSVRSYNERLVLSLLLQNERISRLEIGERTGLSAQTVSVIVRSLEQEGLVVKGEAQRGRVGPPTIPLSLNPEGAYAVGVSFGAQAVDIVLIDFVGDLRRHTTHPYGGFPAFTLTDHIKAALAATPIEATSRIAGIGLAVPNEVTLSGDVERVLGRDLTQAQRWIEREVSHPVYLQNDITAAASGESLFGVARPLSDFIYFYLGSRLHSRLILNHQIYNGRTAEHDTIGLARLSEALSRYDLSLQDLGLLDHHPAAAGAYAAWRRDCCKRIADAVGSLLHFVCVKSLVLSTYAPSSVAESLRAGLSDAMPTMQILLGRPSPTPKAVGAASLPYHSRLMVE